MGTIPDIPEGHVRVSCYWNADYPGLGQRVEGTVVAGGVLMEAGSFTFFDHCAVEGLVGQRPKITGTDDEAEIVAAEVRDMPGGGRGLYVTMDVPKEALPKDSLALDVTLAVSSGGLHGVG
jgi:hypothetical protein